MFKNIDNIISLINAKDILKIRSIISQLSLSEKVELFREITLKDGVDAILLFRLLDNETSSEIFANLDDDEQIVIVMNLTNSETVQIVNELYTDEIAHLLEDMPSKVKKMILSHVDKTTRIKINNILDFDDEHIGSFMSVDIILINENDTNKQALEKIREQREHLELAPYFFVVDSKSKFLGYVAFEDIVFSHPRSLAKKNMKKVTPLYTYQDKEKASVIFAKENLSILPVLDANNVVLGMLTSDEVIDILNEEATEDIYKNVGIITSDAVPYYKQSIISIVKSRFFWLVILMIGSTLTQLIIDKYGAFAEAEIGSTIASTGLLALVPVVSGVSGNSGSQSASTITRSIALGETNHIKPSKIILKELKVGSIIGFLLFVVNFLRLLVYYAISGEIWAEHKNTYYLLMLASSVALFITILVSKIFGSSIPLLAYKFKKDPAVLSSPILTTLIDSLATFIFYSIAILFLFSIF